MGVNFFVGRRALLGGTFLVSIGCLVVDLLVLVVRVRVAFAPRMAFILMHWTGRVVGDTTRALFLLLALRRAILLSTPRTLGLLAVWMNLFGVVARATLVSAGLLLSLYGRYGQLLRVCLQLPEVTKNLNLLGVTVRK